MRAAVALGGDLVVDTVADPVPQKGQVLVASRANGICGSDLHALDAMKAATEGEGESMVAAMMAGEAGAPPLILGHEFCAEIVDFGPGLSAATKQRWPAGQLVCSNPFVGQGELVGYSRSRPGGLAQLMVLDVARLLAVPEGVPAHLAALTEPLAVGIRAAAAASRLTNRGPYVVIGCGPIGLAVTAALAHEGRGPIVASDLSPARREIAAKLGADIVVDPASESPFDQLEGLGFAEVPTSPLLRSRARKQLGPVVFECVGVPGLIQGLLESMPRHSHLVVVGVCGQPDQIVPGLANSKELSIEFVLAYRPSEFAESLRRIAQGRVGIGPMITATVGLGESQWAVDSLRNAEQAKILVEPYRE
jgi:threonine dehydrogenase-like Zn-dependent dehydrogenase